MKTLFVVAPEQQHFRRVEQQQHEAADERPHESLLEDTLNADVIDGQYLQDFRPRSLFTRLFCKLLPPPLLLALIVYRQRRRYDVVVSWDDRVALCPANKNLA